MGLSYKVTVYVDIHRFIFFNDQHGHVKGDEVIIDLEKCLNLIGGEDIKRIGGNKWSFLFEVVDDNLKDKLERFMSYVKASLDIKLNIAIASEEHEKEDALYLLKVASSSGGDLLLTLPFNESYKQVKQVSQLNIKM